MESRIFWRPEPLHQQGRSGACPIKGSRFRIVIERQSSGDPSSPTGKNLRTFSVVGSPPSFRSANRVALDGLIPINTRSRLFAGFTGVGFTGVRRNHRWPICEGAAGNTNSPLCHACQNSLSTPTFYIESRRTHGISGVIGHFVLLGLVPGVSVGACVVEVVPGDGVAPAGDDAGGLMGLTGLIPGIFEGCVGGHGGQDPRCWLRVG